MCAAKRLSKVERKNEIMNSAMKVIREKGFAATTMEDIVAGTTLSKGGVYHYYGSVVEIFRDIMLFGIEYRIDLIKEHLSECKKGGEKQFIAKQFVEKILDDNPYMPLYVEFLIAKKRNPELNGLMEELQEQTKERFQTVMSRASDWLFEQNTFQILTDFINAMIMAVDILGAREIFNKNRQSIEQMFLLLLENEKGNENESL